ncbi:MAG TPA: amidase family protein [Candidatus Dormibacteraeota bacterium]|nr:amidase family protein [Candidatus Dormibacteraeota bacterium]
MSSELCFTPAVELAGRIRSRELSPVELLDAVLARVEAVDPLVHAFVTLDAERARAAARAAEAAVMAGAELGPLHGLPVSVKDLEPVAGVRLTFGSRFYEDHVPESDGVVASRLRAAGAILFGKTNTPAFGHKDMCDNLLMPATRNPWAPDRTSGASSGGAGAAVAAGLGPLAHGSDGAGSIRIPSALCGVFGLKPSYGRVPHWPVSDLWSARSHPGPMARTVRDAALLLGAMAGPDPRDPLSIDAQPEDYVVACSGRVAGLRVAWSADLGYAPVDPEVRRLTEAAARCFERLGCHVEAADPGWDHPGPWHAVLYRAGLAARVGPLAERRPDWIDESLAAVIELGRGVTTSELLAAQASRTRFYEQAQRFMAGYDLLLTPAMPCAAWSWERPPAAIDGQPVQQVAGGRWPLMYPFNLTGWPAASVPCGFTAEGLPVGLQVVAPWHQDAWCVRAAAALEEAMPWADRRPSL